MTSERYLTAWSGLLTAAYRGACINSTLHGWLPARDWRATGGT